MLYLIASQDYVSEEGYNLKEGEEVICIDYILGLHVKCKSLNGVDFTAPQCVFDKFN